MCFAITKVFFLLSFGLWYQFVGWERVQIQGLGCLSGNTKTILGKKFKPEWERPRASGTGPNTGDRMPGSCSAHLCFSIKYHFHFHFQLELLFFWKIVQFYNPKFQGTLPLPVGLLRYKHKSRKIWECCIDNKLKNLSWVMGQK